ncbi:hypothetical protein MJO28_004133, partial [Puccinia striiformis f. sp. tritici]
SPACYHPVEAVSSLVLTTPRFPAADAQHKKVEPPVAEAKLGRPKKGKESAMDVVDPEAERNQARYKANRSVHLIQQRANFRLLFLTREVAILFYLLLAKGVLPGGLALAGIDDFFILALYPAESLTTNAPDFYAEQCLSHLARKSLPGDGQKPIR